MARSVLIGTTVVVLAGVAVLVLRVIPNVVPLQTALLALRQGEAWEGVGSSAAATVPRVGDAFRSGLPYALALQAAQHALDARWFLVVLVLLLAALGLGVYTIRLAMRAPEPAGEPPHTDARRGAGQAAV
jgi:membrane protease YdiL (CAAX protease family)